MRIYGTQKCKQYGSHGIQYPHDIDLHTKRKVSIPKQDIGLTVSKISGVRPKFFKASISREPWVIVRDIKRISVYMISGPRFSSEQMVISLMRNKLSRKY